MANLEPTKQRRGLVAIDGAMALIVILLIVQIWLLSATLEAFLAGHVGQECTRFSPVSVSVRRSVMAAVNFDQFPPQRRSRRRMRRTTIRRKWRRVKRACINYCTKIVQSGGFPNFGHNTRSTKGLANELLARPLVHFNLQMR